MRKSRLVLAISFVIYLCLANPTKSNAGAPSEAIQITDSSHADPLSEEAQFPNQRDPKSAAELKLEKQLEKERQKQRWQDIKRRSEQLLEIATELKQYVDKSGENVMSVEVIKKAEQMEKLSKDLQKKMKGD